MKPTRWERTSSKKTQLLHSRNNLMAAYKREFLVWELHINFSTSQKQVLLKRLSTASGLQGMLERKDYCAVEEVFFVSRRLSRRVHGVRNQFCFNINTHNQFRQCESYLHEPCSLTAHDGDAAYVSLKIRRLKLKAKTCLRFLKI